MKKLTMLSALFLVAGCGEPIKPQAVQGTSNPGATVFFLFEHEGVKVYKFEDGGNTVYYTTAPGVATQFHDVDDGEGGSHTEQVRTITGGRAPLR